MALFVNILIHPLDPRAQTDLEILIAAVRIIESIPLRLLSTYETEHLHGLNDFIMYLFRLGSCAVWKAQNEGETPRRVASMRNGRMMSDLSP